MAKFLPEETIYLLPGGIRLPLGTRLKSRTRTGTPNFADISAALADPSFVANTYTADQSAEIAEKHLHMDRKFMNSSFFNYIKQQILNIPIFRAEFISLLRIYSAEIRRAISKEQGKGKQEDSTITTTTLEILINLLIDNPFAPDRSIPQTGGAQGS